VRFLASGPSIPEQLLVARDEGSVIFFCGAGVSRARAGLADFFGLANQVLDDLETGVQTPTRRFFEAAKRVETETVSADLCPRMGSSACSNVRMGHPVYRVAGDSRLRVSRARSSKPLAKRSFSVCGWGI
jgi:hypothetical protein